MTSRPFAQTNAVVTGASSGIGRAIAVALCRSGVSRIVIHYCRNQRGANETADQCRRHGAEPILAACDLADPHSVDRFANQCFSQLADISTWINNAGADVLTTEMAGKSFAEKLALLTSVDLLGTIRLARIAAEQMMANPSDLPPSMCFLGWDQSCGGMEGDAGQMFAPVKAAITAFAKSLAQSCGPRLRVNTIAPGWIRTAWGESADEYWDARAKSQSLMRRWGTPDDVARGVLFATNPHNTFFTGQLVQVNGGWNRRFDVDAPETFGGAPTKHS
ncbi:3-oxoacyl-[acyl-carrier-protein] reductase FabG [Novipirellula aureliae]|uniref:3-oxoacyl-[acyl-carrier-protein] reductase FabG n=1 Tax=Novipirellula aureliae TaxID=2527966 RepID=A0A5C6E2D7_9BACT|nr:SDR family oxidoreductase [Novipirellula aureliae]TWU43092.1 3-oxoacyl-[acyl-carrier-protein] reductase FabG [Novipirellula aureliae]